MMLMKADPQDIYVPAELSDTVKRLENWGRWAVERQKRRTAASAEGKYRPRYGNNQSEEDALELARRGGSDSIDPFDAQLVGKVLAPANGFPKKAFILLRWIYFLRSRDKEMICWRVGCRSADYEEKHAEAVRMLENRLLRRDLT